MNQALNHVKHLVHRRGCGVIYGLDTDVFYSSILAQPKGCVQHSPGVFLPSINTTCATARVWEVTLRRVIVDTVRRGSRGITDRA